ncbi:MAG: hypothetical protein K0R00_3173 [Herbinix sp.]|jgi:hypothetical protein|nr:hypothetical protein [Herbinix sp.]
MPVISVRVTNEEYAKIISDAVKSNSVSEYVHDKLFPESISSITSSRALTIAEVLEKIKTQHKSGDTIEIPELFTSEEWATFNNTVSIGRMFRIASKNNRSEVAKTVRFVEKKSGQAAKYQVI